MGLASKEIKGGKAQNAIIFFIEKENTQESKRDEEEMGELTDNLKIEKEYVAFTFS